MVGCPSVSWINSSSICCGFAAELRHVQQILIDKMPAPHTGYQWIAAGARAAAVALANLRYINALNNNNNNK